MVGDQAGFVQAAGQVHKVHEGPGEVVVDNVGFPGQGAESADCRQGKSGGRYLQVQLGLVGHVAAQVDRLLCGVRAEREHIGAHAEVGNATGDLENDLLYPAHGVGVIGLVEV
ncbi:hypothetical protein D3C80_1876890 [compost metagenome]